MSEKAIVLVEDNPDDETLVRMALGKAGFPADLTVARDGQQALDVLLSGSRRVPPRVVILDLKLPKVDGLEVLERLKSEEWTRLVPVVILTSSDEEIDRHRSYELGANSYVCKPVDFAEFERVVRRLGEYWLTCNQPPKD